MDTNYDFDEAFRFSPDGYTEERIDALLTWAYAQSDQGIPPTTALLDGSAARRRDQRITRRLAQVVPLRPSSPEEPGTEAA